MKQSKQLKVKSYKVKSRGRFETCQNKKRHCEEHRDEANQKNKEKNRLLPASFLAVRNDEQTKLNNE
jgi:hypothetical protein